MHSCNGCVILRGEYSLICRIQSPLRRVDTFRASTSRFNLEKDDNVNTLRKAGKSVGEEEMEKEEKKRVEKVWGRKIWGKRRKRSWLDAMGSFATCKATLVTR